MLALLFRSVRKHREGVGNVLVAFIDEIEVAFVRRHGL